MPSRIRIGPDGGPYVIVEEDNGDVNISSPNGNVDFQTDDISNVDTLNATNGDIDSLNTANLNNTINLNRYDTLQAAVDDVPPGGTLYVPAKPTPYSTADIGTATTDKQFRLVGAGASRDADLNYEGAYIDNELDEPILTWDGYLNSTTHTPNHVEISNLGVLHRGSGPAFDVSNITKLLTYRNIVDCKNLGGGFLKLSGDSWSSAHVHNQVFAFTGNGYEIRSDGYYCLIQSGAVTSEQTGAVGIVSDQSRTTLKQIQVDGPGPGAILGHNKDVTDCYLEGYTSERGNVGIQLGSATNMARRTTGHMYGGDVYNQGLTAIRFKNSQRSRIRVTADFGAALATYETDSSHDTIFVDHRKNGSVTDNGAIKPLAICRASLSDTELQNFDFIGSIPILILSGAFHNFLPIAHDGTDWYAPSSSTFTP